METGISDHHGLIFLFLIAAFANISPNKLQYRKHKNHIHHIHFYKMLDNYSKKLVIRNRKILCENVRKIWSSLNESDSRKSKSFITKNLRKGIMKRSALKKRANVSNNREIIELYKKQRKKKR